MNKLTNTQFFRVVSKITKLPRQPSENQTDRQPLSSAFLGLICVFCFYFFSHDVFDAGERTADQSLRDMKSLQDYKYLRRRYLDISI